MLKKILGSSPRTSLAGYVLAALLTWQQVEKEGETNWKKMLVPVSIAILGRVVKDSDGVHRRKTKKIVERVLPEKTESK